MMECNKPTAILMSDPHYTSQTPEKRTDDYEKAQLRKLIFIQELSNKYGGIPILSAGDTLNKWKEEPWLITRLIMNLKNYITIPGQHDVPQHNMEQLGKSSLSTLEAAKGISILKSPDNIYKHKNIRIAGFPWGCELRPYKRKKPTGVKAVALIHKLIRKGKKEWHGMEAPQALFVLKRMKRFDLIVTGDNHKPFTVEHDGRLLVNPGSMMRMTTAQSEHRPRVYLWYSQHNQVKPVYLPIEKDVFDMSEVEEVKEKDRRIERFIESLDIATGTGLELSFKKNLEEFIANNKIDKVVENIIWEAVG